MNIFVKKSKINFYKYVLIVLSVEDFCIVDFDGYFSAIVIN